MISDSPTQDIFSLLAKSLYIKDDAARAASWSEVLTTAVPAQLALLEKLIGDNGLFSPNRLLVGDILIICILQILTEIEGNANALDNFPKLKAFFTNNRDAVLTPEFLKVHPYVVKK